MCNRRMIREPKNGEPAVLPELAALCDTTLESPGRYSKITTGPYRPVLQFSWFIWISIAAW